MLSRFLVACLLVATCTASYAEDLRVLFLGDNGHHQPRVRFNELAPILAGRGIDLSYTDRVDDLIDLSKDKYSALVVYANIDNITPEQAKGLLSYVQSGGGFAPLHCASFCFRNNDEVVALMGAQFTRHGTGVFRTITADPQHPIMQGMRDMESWDETYVHSKHNEKDRTVLQYRVDNEGREPWTWVKPYGQGRVFYTAWGHDDRTWSNAGFAQLVERGIRWVAGQKLEPASSFYTPEEVKKAVMTALPTGKAPFSYVDVGREIPNYTPSKQWGEQGDNHSLMQQPLTPQESIKRMGVPQGFHLELFVSEPELVGKPIAMTWDERGRLWVAETYDYPNELQPEGQGRDRIRICEDTNGDGKADKFTVFAEKLSIPSSIAFAHGHVLVQDGTKTLKLTDTNGDDVSDKREVMFGGWGLGDTHGGVSNFQYGVDNWIWGMQGYNYSAPTIKGVPQEAFSMGFFRFKPDGSKLEFIRSTNNNTWGLGISEEGLIFGSTANGNPSVFMPIANRYYERVRGWAPQLTLSSIADTNKFKPAVEQSKVRQVDYHGGYTAAAGHALYTARQFPSQYWNQTAFVTEPTGHLAGTFILRREGFGYKSTNPFNLVASDDEWTAPIMAEVGPDGCVWVIDWYNFIVQHNPTPEGFDTGKGAAYETKLRDKKHGRIYRVVYDGMPVAKVPDLAKADTAGLVAALTHPTMLVRKHAQRLLVEKGDKSAKTALLKLVQDRSVDEVGLNVGAIHALWALAGLGLVDASQPDVLTAVYEALEHPAPGVRRNAVQVLPATPESTSKLLASSVVFDIDTQVRLAAVLALSDLPTSLEGAEKIVATLQSAEGPSRLYLRDAATSAAAQHGALFLQAVAQSKNINDPVREVTAIVAGHIARGNNPSQMGDLISALNKGDMDIAGSIIGGLLSGSRDAGKVTLTAAQQKDLLELVEKLPVSAQVQLISLTHLWGIDTLAKYSNEIEGKLTATVTDENASVAERADAARRLIEFKPLSKEPVSVLLEQWSPRMDPALATGILDALSLSRASDLGAQLVEILPNMTPGSRTSAINMILKRPEMTREFVSAAQAGKVSIDDLTLDQKQALANHPTREISQLAQKLLAAGGSLPNVDRQKVVDELLSVTKEKGDVATGKAMFTKHCSACHIHSGVGNQVGPDLTGMAVHPKAELLVHILDPSRSVEGNFKLYTVLTSDGSVLSGTLASESKTAIDLFDAQGKRRAILREDIESMTASRKSIMPEGFEKQMTPNELRDLLEFLTARGTFLPLDFSKVATISSGKPMFYGSDPGERMMFDDWSPKTFRGVPFQLIDPKDGGVFNVIMLFGPEGTVTSKMPRSVTLPCGGPVTRLHLLSGISGWGFPFGGGKEKSVSMIVRFKYEDGSTEDHELRNGVEFADYIRRIDVPGSEYAFDLQGKQVRYLSLSPKKNVPVQSIELVKGPDNTAPIVMAATVEGSSTGH